MMRWLPALPPPRSCLRTCVCPHLAYAWQMIRLRPGTQVHPAFQSLEACACSLSCVPNMYVGAVYPTLPCSHPRRPRTPSLPALPLSLAAGPPEVLSNDEENQGECAPATYPSLPCSVALPFSPEAGRRPYVLRGM